jgi:hypothetical protein
MSPAVIAESQPKTGLPGLEEGAHELDRVGVGSQLSVGV